MTASSAFTIQNGANATAVSGTGTVIVSPGQTITVALSSSTSVVSWRVKGTWFDLTGAPSSPLNPIFYTAQTTGFTYSFVAPSSPGMVLVTSAADDGSGTIPTASCNMGIGTELATQDYVPSFRARNVVIANVASLAAFTGVTGGAANNGVTCVQGDMVLLVNQTTVAQNGLYQVGVVSGGVAPLTRVGSMAAGNQILPDTIVQVGSEPTVGKNTQWRASISGQAGVYGTNDPQFVCDWGNSYDMLSTTVGTRTGSGAAQFVAAVLVVPKTTGIFEVNVDVGWSDGTTGETVTWALVSDTSAAGVLAGANNVTHGIAGVTAGIGSVAATGVSCDTNAGAAVTYNGAAFTTAPITHATEGNPTLTGLLSASAQKFQFSGRCYNVLASGTTKTPFTLGNTVAFGLSVSNAAGTITIPRLHISVKEVPAG